MAHVPGHVDRFRALGPTDTPWRTTIRGGNELAGYQEGSEDEQKRDGCSCEDQTEFEASDSEADYMDDAHVDLHCAMHGVDAVNALGPPEFATMARTKPWVRSPLSRLPISAMGRPIGVLDYAGRGLPGRIGLVEDQGFLAIEGWRNGASENYVRVSESLRNSHSEPTSDQAGTIGRTNR